MAGDGDVQVLGVRGSQPRYSPTGHIIYAQAGSLMALPFSLEHLEVTGTPYEVLDGVVTTDSFGTAHYAFSPTGDMVYLPGGPSVRDTELVWVSPQDSEERVVPLPRGSYVDARIGPDGERLLIRISGGNENLALYEPRSGLTSLAADWDQETPIWHPDGERVTYRHTQGDQRSIRTRRLDGEGAVEEHVSGNTQMSPASWHPEGNILAYSQSAPDGAIDSLLFYVDEKRSEALPGVSSTAFGAQFSPDGHWIAYSARDGGGDAQVYVRAFPGPGERVQISTAGGGPPRWSPDGTVLYYRTDGQLKAVPLSTSGGLLQVGTAEIRLNNVLVRYDVAADGRVVFIRALRAGWPPQFSLIPSWFDELIRMREFGR